ncbi:MAG: hypothetical protein MR848_04615 [Butyricimonas virosa]|nr:hypothetical protein [Butyricimonas virosa]
MDVNEKIVECWLNNCKEMFTMSDVVYDKYFSAIDLLAVGLKGESGIEVWDIEVKFKSKIIISDTDNRQNGYRYIRQQLVSNDRDKRVREIIASSNCEIKKVLITTRHFLSQKKATYWEERFRKDGITLYFFDDIIVELREHAKGLNKSNDDILQVLRLLDHLSI